MGEAAETRQTDLKDRVLAELEKHLVATSPEEVRLIDEIRSLQFYRCTRFPEQRLAVMWATARAECKRDTCTRHRCGRPVLGFAYRVSGETFAAPNHCSNV